MKAKEILLKAANIMELRGKCGGILIDGGGRCCTIGALVLAGFNNDSRKIEKDFTSYSWILNEAKVIEAAYKFLEFIGDGTEIDNLYCWNDYSQAEDWMKHRPQVKPPSAQEVILAFRACAAELPDESQA